MRSAARHAEDYQPGYFLARLAKDCPLLPARIWRPCHCTVNGGLDSETHDWRGTCDRYGHLVAEINGQPASLWRVWTSRDEITEAEFRYRTDAAAWDLANDPDAPFANPTEPVDVRAMKPIF